MLVKSNDSDSENNKSSDVTHSYSGTRTVAENSKSAASIAEARLLAFVAAAGFKGMKQCEFDHDPADSRAPPADTLRAP